MQDSINWRHAPQPLQNHTCACCGESVQFTTGLIYDEHGEELALYGATLTPTSPCVVDLFVMFKAKAKKGGKGRDYVVSLTLRTKQGKVVTPVITDRVNPLGRPMTRQQVLASPFKTLIFQIADFIVEKDSHVRPFLEGTERPKQGANQL
jgi:hypothetical protein